MTLRLSLLSFMFIAACSTDSSKSTGSGSDVITPDTAGSDGTGRTSSIDSGSTTPDAAGSDGADATDATDGGNAADATDGSDGTDGEVVFTGQEAISSGGTYLGRLSGLDDGLRLGDTGSGSLVVTLTDDGTPANVAIDASFIHQGMGHGGPKAPKLTGGANGAYTVADLVPSMAGTWELLLEVSGSTGMETITFEIDVTQ